MKVGGSKELKMAMRKQNKSDSLHATGSVVRGVAEFMCSFKNEHFHSSLTYKANYMLLTLGSSLTYKANYLFLTLGSTHIE